MYINDINVDRDSSSIITRTLTPKPRSENNRTIWGRYTYVTSIIIDRTVKNVEVDSEGNKVGRRIARTCMVTETVTRSRELIIRPFWALSQTVINLNRLVLYMRYMLHQQSLCGMRFPKDDLWWFSVILRCCCNVGSVFPHPKFNMYSKGTFLLLQILESSCCN
jgi:hypothetical protein